MTTRAAVTEKIVINRLRKGLKWAEIAAKVGKSPVWTTAALLGQMPMAPEEAKIAGGLLDLTDEEILLLTVVPYRGALPPGPPTDPTVYRFYELVQVYGTTWKELIHEEFGDGIMSAIDYDMTMERLPDPNGDRVKIVMTGKYLKYKKY
jgi:cyanate lyase